MRAAVLLGIPTILPIKDKQPFASCAFAFVIKTPPKDESQQAGKLSPHYYFVALVYISAELLGNLL